jgi:hypothetical protein
VQDKNPNFVAVLLSECRGGIIWTMDDGELVFICGLLCYYSKDLAT